MRILVTGSNGFIGEWVIKELGSTAYQIIRFTGDLREKDTFPDGPFSTIIHLAALITHRGKYEKNLLYDVNVEGTRNLLNHYIDTKMVFISTTDVTRERRSDYACTKLEAEKLVLENEANAIVRLPSIFGPKQRQKKLIRLLFEKYCLNGNCTITNNDKREYLFVAEAAKQIINCIDKRGIITLTGYKIRNHDLDKMIQSICAGNLMRDLKGNEKKFYNQLKLCVPEKSNF